MSALRDVALVAGVVFRDVARRPSAWRTTLLAATVFAILFIGLGATTQRVEDRAVDRSFAVAVHDPDGGGAGLVDLIGADPRLIPHVDDDPGALVTERRAAVGLALPPQADELLAGGRPVPVTVYRRADEVTSLEATTLLTQRLQAIELERLAAGVEGEVAPEVDEVPVSRLASVNRRELAAPLAAILCLLCLTVVSSVAAVLGGASDQRSRESLLLLPLHRLRLCAGVALGAFPLAAVQLGLALVVVSLTTALPTASLGQPWESVASIVAWTLLGGVLIGGLAAATGALAGALGTGSDDAVGLGDFLALPFVVVGATLFLSPQLAPAAPWHLVPVVGQVLVVRDGIAGDATVAQVIVAVAAAVGWFVALASLAGRRVGDERRVLRSIR